MKLRRSHICALALLLLLAGCKPKEISKVGLAELQTKDIYFAGQDIRLDLVFKGLFDQKEDYSLHIQHGFYQTSLKADSCEAGSCGILLPKAIANKTGRVQWQLYFGDELHHEGNFFILRQPEEGVLLQTYLGPPSTKAGKEKAAMAVSIPTDSYGNLILNNDTVRYAYRYLNQRFESESSLMNGLAYLELDSGPLASTLELGSQYKEAKATTTTLEVMPEDAIDFELTVERVNNIADGQQELTIKTTTITDGFGNIVSDGTLVTLNISNGEYKEVSMPGATINGVATFNLLHPPNKEYWAYMASVADLASSPTYVLDFEAFTEELPYHWDREANTLTVGPIVGKLNDLVTDGTLVGLFGPSDQLETRQTEQGKVAFDLERLGITDLRGYQIAAMGINVFIE